MCFVDPEEINLLSNSYECEQIHVNIVFFETTAHYEPCYNKKSLIKKTFPRSKWIILRVLKTNQILKSAFFVFIQNFNYSKIKNIHFY